MSRKRRLSYGARERRTGIKLLLPSVIFVGVLIILPILYNIYLTFHYVSVFNPRNPRFVGFGNYVRLLSNEAFWSDLVTGVLYTYTSVFFMQTLAYEQALFKIQSPFLQFPFHS